MWNNNSVFGIKRQQKLNHKWRLHEEKEGSKALGEFERAVAGQRKREAAGRHRHLPLTSGACRARDTAALAAHAQLAE